MGKDDLYKEYHKLVYYITNLYPNYRFEQDELIGEGMIGLVKAYNAFDFNRPGITFYTYASRVIHNEIRMYIRKRKIRQHVLPALHFEAPVGDLPSDDGPVTLADTLGYEGDLSEIEVEQFLNTLKPKDQHILKMAMLGTSFTVIAKSVGVHPSHISRLVRQLGYEYLYNKDQEYIRFKSMLK